MDPDTLFRAQEGPASPARSVEILSWSSDEEDLEEVLESQEETCLQRHMTEEAQLAEGARAGATTQSDSQPHERENEQVGTAATAKQISSAIHVPKEYDNTARSSEHMTVPLLHYSSSCSSSTERRAPQGLPLAAAPVVCSLPCCHPHRRPTSRAKVQMLLLWI